MLPRNNIPIKIAMTINVIPAFLGSGFLKDGTPLLIDSMPVRAVQPAENACKTKNKLNGVTGGGEIPTREIVPCWTHLIKPMPSIGK